jgi:hypothetical protein
MILEKRKLERFDLALPATIRAGGPHSQDKDAITRLLTKNICEGGAYFSTSQPLPEGTDVRVDLILPLSGFKLKRIKEDKAQISVDGTVLRSEAKGMAIGFAKGYAMIALSA